MGEHLNGDTSKARRGILALDPGGTTGVAWAVYEDGADRFLETQSFQIGPHEHHQELASLLEQAAAHENMVTAFVIESFEYRNRARPGLELISREYIGVTKLISDIHDIPLIVQSASQAKAFVKDEQLKKLGLWSAKTKDRHAHDAWRHLLTFVINHDPFSDNLRQPLLKAAWK